jgi:hypothetical protein
VEDRRSSFVNDGRAPKWDRFDPAVKKWCEDHSFDSVFAARKAWTNENRGKCFWTCSELGVVMGGTCKRGDQCRFVDSHA